MCVGSLLHGRLSAAQGRDLSCQPAHRQFQQDCCDPWGSHTIFSKHIICARPTQALIRALDGTVERATGPLGKYKQGQLFLACQVAEATTNQLALIAKRVLLAYKSAAANLELIPLASPGRGESQVMLQLTWSLESPSGQSGKAGWSWPLQPGEGGRAVPACVCQGDQWLVQ